VTLPNGVAVPEKPEWFQKGHNVEKLLRDAEDLDWMVDSGTPLDFDELKKAQMASTSRLVGLILSLS
jgi:hypothetical protein